MSAVLKQVPTETVSIEYITPDVAAEMLRLNTANRPLRRDWVSGIAAAMQRGAWKFNGDAIRITSSNVLADGQHRLAAVVKTGLPMRAVVVLGLDPTAFPTIDTGAKRTAANMLAVNGEKHYSSLAAACKVMFNLSRGYSLTAGGGKVAHDQVLELIKEYPELRYWTNYVVGRKRLKSLFDSSIVAIATVFQRKYGLEIIEQFMDQLESGENLSRKDPAYVLRARAIQNKTSAVKMRGELFSPLIIKAFSAHVEGRQISVLRMLPDEAFPTI